MTAVPVRPAPTRAARLRFVAALAVYLLWIAGLAAMAFTASEPPDPNAGANPGAAVPRGGRP